MGDSDGPLGFWSDRRIIPSVSDDNDPKVVDFPVTDTGVPALISACGKWSDSRHRQLRNIEPDEIQPASLDLRLGQLRLR